MLKTEIPEVVIGNGNLGSDQTEGGWEEVKEMRKSKKCKDRLLNKWTTGYQSHPTYK